MKASRFGSNCLDTLLEGSYARAIDLYEHDLLPEGVAPGSAEAGLWRAEIALYLDRVDEAAASLDGVAPEATGPVLGDVALWARTIRAGIAYARGQFAEAIEAAGSALGAARETNDDQIAMRASYDLGRAHRRRGDHEEAVAFLALAQEAALRQRNEFYKGLVAFNRAQLRYELGDAEGATGKAREAVAILAASENLRYRALAQNFYGGLLADAGRIAESIELATEAEQTAVRLRVEEDALRAAHNGARALLSLGRYEETVERLSSLLKWERAAGTSFVEMRALLLLASALVATRRYDDAATAAGEALRLAGLVGTDNDRFDARVYLARARALAAEDPAKEVDTLRDLVAEADRRRNDIQRIETRAYLAQILVRSAPLRAHELCAQARAIPGVESAGWIRNELERAEHDLARAPVRLDERDRLVIDPSASWPNRRAAHEILDEYLFTRSVAAMNGNASAAGRLIGESRYQMFALSRFVQGRAPRSSRSKKALEGEAVTPKRRHMRRVMPDTGNEE